MPKAEFPASIKVGGQIQHPGPDGTPRYYFVTKTKGPTLLLDGNHPLCGKTLRFAIAVVDVRAASAEEIAHRMCMASTGTGTDSPATRNNKALHSGSGGLCFVWNTAGIAPAVNG